MFIQKKARIVEFMNCLEQFDGFGKNKINIPTASGTVSNASVAGTQNL